jgi:protein PhnA
MSDALRRAGGACELCTSADGLTAIDVAPSDTEQIVLCPTCAPQVAGDVPLNAKHWFCLQESAWSEHPPVQVVAYRLLSKLSSEGWASDLLDQLYLDETTLAWAQADATEAARPPTLDSNGTALQDGDTVTLIKDLVVKGANFTAKRGTVVKGIRLTDDPGNVEGRIQRATIVLKTEFLKRA